ncbi:inositol monophosphatase family protein [Streptacidiphilus fuscans]|uniref:inositol monophosphatase family protein n=1 Tax=Streptacidiphilus fuscans TaxID=2789292 RepID=UPI002E2D3ACC|nr:inositol monophosphatase [Streptacidiphilus fuscans]
MTATTTPQSALLPGLADAAQEVGALLLRTPRPPIAADPDALRRAFEAVEEPAVELLRRRLDDLLPGTPWADEMDTELPERGAIWVVDAVDGAVQLLQDLPQFCVSLTLVRDREPVATALHAPVLGETYMAARGAGATRNGTAIRPSAKAELAACVVASSHPPLLCASQPGLATAIGAALAAVLSEVLAVRNLGPTAWQVADTAAGRLDAFWQLGRDDANLLGGALLAREAGALVTDALGAPWRAGANGILVAPPALHARLLELLRDRSAMRQVS